MVLAPIGMMAITATMMVVVPIAVIAPITPLGQE